VLSVIFSTSAFAQEKKVVRVGWYDSEPFIYFDRFGRRRGYAYEYQQKIAAYTGWTYEYVDGSWPQLLDKLQKGEIDLLSDVSYTNEREKTMLFASLPMGSEFYYVVTTPENINVTADELTSFNGKKIGVNKNSVQEEIFRQWVQKNGLNVKIIELLESTKETEQMLRRGDLDALVGVDVYGGNEETYVPILNVGHSEFYFAVNRARPDLLADLNAAMNKIQEENLFYNQHLHEKYKRSAGVNAFLGKNETQWLAQHGAIRVGYLAECLPFCSCDQADNLIGTLKDYLDIARHCTKNAEINFETQSYKNLNDALDALSKSDVDCIFPISLDTYDGEQRGIMITNPLIQTEMYALVRKSDTLGISAEREMTVAICEDDLNHESFLKDNFPKWNIKHYKTLEKCFQAVETKEADCILTNSFRIAPIESLSDEYNFFSVTTGATMDLGFAIRTTDSELYHILNKATALVPRATINSSLTTYSMPDNTFSLTQFLKENWNWTILTILTFSTLIVMFLKEKMELKNRLLEYEQRNKILEYEHQKHQYDEMINAMASNYLSVYCVNLEEDDGICYRKDTTNAISIDKGEHFTFSKIFTDYANLYVTKEYRTDFLKFISPNSIRDNLQKNSILTYRYLSKRDGLERYEMIRMVGVNTTDDSSVRLISVGLADIDTEMREEMAKSQALSEALKTAEEASKAKTTFLSSMSHEIRTPMNAIIGFDNLALQEPRIPDNIKGYLEKIGSSAQHLLSLINDILDMSRIESGNMKLRNEEFSFPKLIEQINTIFSGQASERKLKYNCRINGHFNEYYIGDSIKLRQVLINILGNAFKFTPEGGSVDLIIEKTADFDKKSVLRFQIKDTGIGISKEYLPKIFEAFSQENAGNTNKYGSTGLGMAITKNIVDMMNGKIEVDSEKKVGTTFTVTVTFMHSDKNDTLSEDFEIKPHEMKVLVIDAAPVDCNHAKLTFETVGIAAETVMSGAEAVEMIKLRHARLEPYNLILVDLQMPKLNGVETARQIRSVIGNDNTVILMTTYNRNNETDEATKAGVDGFITKPLFAGVLIEEFKKALRKKNKVTAQTQTKAELKGRKILLAEDMPVNAEIMMMVLQMREVDAELAENGKIALQMFERSPVNYYDTILMDMRMPEMDGLEATQRIRALDRPDAKTIPIIALTANAFDEDVQRSLQAGLNAHLSKPVEPEILFETLERLIQP
jgi:signal transduction histidine kinase/CheY-like chemotaxis protein/ABC-type amino acid transport substrate-binding protein